MSKDYYPEFENDIRNETFTELKDAITFLERAVDDLPDKWVIYYSGINWIANRWRVSFAAGPAYKDYY